MWRNLISILLLTTSLSAFAGGGSSGIEMANLVEDTYTAGSTAASVTNEMTQIANQIQLIQNAVKNTNNISDYQWQDLSSLVQRLDDVTRQGQALSYASANIDSDFRKKYPNYNQQGSGGAIPYFPVAYQNWSTTLLDTLRTTLSSAGMNMRDFNTEQDTLNTLTEQGKTARGRMQVLQVSTEIAAQNVNQLQSLKRLVAAQTSAQNNYMAYKVSKDNYQEKSLDDVNSHLDSKFPQYKNNANFGLIKEFN